MNLGNSLVDSFTSAYVDEYEKSGYNNLMVYDEKTEFLAEIEEKREKDPQSVSLELNKLSNR